MCGAAADIASIISGDLERILRAAPIVDRESKMNRTDAAPLMSLANAVTAFAHPYASAAAWLDGCLPSSHFAPVAYILPSYTAMAPQPVKDASLYRCIA